MEGFFCVCVGGAVFVIFKMKKFKKKKEKEDSLVLRLLVDGVKFPLCLKNRKAWCCMLCVKELHADGANARHIFFYYESCEKFYP